MFPGRLTAPTARSIRVVYNRPEVPGLGSLLFGIENGLLTGKGTYACVSDLAPNQEVGVKGGQAVRGTQAVEQSGPESISEAGPRHASSCSAGT